MSDITKARHYLKSRQSKLQHLTSFGLMLATAENEYRTLRLNQKGNRAWETFEDKEIETSLDYAVLRYLNKFNQLPRNITDAFRPGITLEEKKTLAMAWIGT